LHIREDTVSDLVQPWRREVGMVVLRTRHLSRATTGDRDLRARRARDIGASPWDFDLSMITAPVSIWQGTEDTNVPIASVRSLAARIPRSSVNIFPGEGHLIVPPIGTRSSRSSGLSSHAPCDGARNCVRGGTRATVLLVGRAIMAMDGGVVQPHRSERRTSHTCHGVRARCSHVTCTTALRVRGPDSVKLNRCPNVTARRDTLADEGMPS
jgi:hypothetical protein